MYFFIKNYVRSILVSQIISNSLYNCLFFTFLPNDGDDDVAIVLPCVHDDDASDGYDPYPVAF